MRKSRREKEKEAADAKRKEEEEDAAKAYAEFLHTFQGEDVDRKKSGATFVKAGQEASYAPFSHTAESSRTGRMFAVDAGASALFIWNRGFTKPFLIASVSAAGSL